MNRLMPNYGWVQNTSNLSTIRDAIDLIPEHGIKHSELMNAIKAYRESINDLPKRWNWDARCRIKGLHATGLIKLNRYIQGYDLTDLGRRLKTLPKSSNYERGFRLLTEAESGVFKEGLLTNPPVIKVLSLFEKDRKSDHRGLSKYDVGKELGFVGDIGFTHLDPFWIESNGYSFSDKEGDADKWARTIISWLNQVGWVKPFGTQRIGNRELIIYTSSEQVEVILKYDAQRIVRNVPVEMLCSGHHPFPKLIQKRRSIILQSLSSKECTADELVATITSNGIRFDQKDCEFEVINLQNAGFRIIENGGYYKLIDKIELDIPPIVVESQDVDSLEKLIEEMVLKYERTLPLKLIDHLIRFGCDPAHSTEFEGIVAEFFRNIGYKAEYLGQGRGRVTDVLVKYIHPSTYAKSYGVIVDAKSTSSKYNFPVGDKRKMKEYIGLHGPKLMAEAIQRHAFAFASFDFITNLEPHLQEITDDTAIGGCAIDIFALLEMGHKVNKGIISLNDLYPNFVTNRRFSI